MSKPRVQLKIENFGPIVEGTVEFKPLTFLIGPNNSGKTYVATLLDALSNSLVGGFGYPIRIPSHDLSMVPPFLIEKAQAGAKTLLVDDLPSALVEELELFYGPFIEQVSLHVEGTLQRHLSVGDLDELTNRKTKSENGFCVESFVTGAMTPFLHVSSSSSTSRVEINRVLPDWMTLPGMVLPDTLGHHDFLLANLASDLWYKNLYDMGYRREGSYYLPATRSGVLASWALFASLAVRNVSSALGRQETEVAPLPGVLGDFLQVAIGQILSGVGRNGRNRMRSDLRPVLDIIEGEVLSGRVVVDRSRPYSAQLMYETDVLRIPLQRASSMVAELAPVDLWVRELLEPGDLLIIDEPESHLHPENQRLIARALVRLVNAGVDVVAPTHSSTILHQVSNMLLASRADDATRTKLGFTEADRIAMEDVAVYLFEREADGIYIREVPIDPEFGISEEEFVRVSEAIGDETFQLEFAAAQ